MTISDSWSTSWMSLVRCCETEAVICIIVIVKIVLAQLCKSQRYHQHEAHQLKFGNKTANLLSCFPNQCFDTLGIEHPLHITLSHSWNATRTYLPQVGFLQVMHTHHVASCFMTFLRFRGRSKMTEEGIAITFSSETFFMRTSCISYIMNFRILNILPVHIWNNIFPWCYAYRVSLA